MSHLTEIVEYKRKEIEPWLGHNEEWKIRAKSLTPFRSFKEPLLNEPFGFVAEVKKASPSAGVIVQDFDPLRTAQIYDESGATCISVLTDERFFHGHLDYLALIRKKVNRPLLRKDFTLHEVQIYQAALAGADCVLLIVAALLKDDLAHLMTAAQDIGIDCLVEVHDESELERALEANAEFLGINNRDLASFDLRLEVTEKLAPLIPDHCVVVSESGIRTVEDVRRVAAAGVDAALIGESLMRAADPHSLLEEFRDAVLAVRG
ncbi:MAG: indole-3-glycerol phosphate synthase TrpC [Verrucomicrobia bacterium]|nr:indole-3-glycerol phosphate synthase TrpC [Verrucomicrobiota bacterium]MBV9674101.1 indole-3-glycerol phosphate synthase TrpC [Verrucomicrobiota bacterium]